MFGIGTLVRIFAMLDSETIRTILIIDRKITDILAIFIVTDIEAHVTIFIVHAVIGIIGILAGLIHHAGSRTFYTQLIILLKERLRKVKFATIVEGIPLIWSSDMLIVDFALLLRMIDRDYFFSWKITRPLVQIPFIAKWESSLISTVRAEGGMEQWIFFISDNRRKFIIHFNILIGNIERGSAVGTLFSFNDLLLHEIGLER